MLIPIVTSEDPYFNTDFKYISFINLVLPIKSYEPEKICLVLENRGKHPLKIIESPLNENHTIRFGVLENTTAEV